MDLQSLLTASNQKNYSLLLKKLENVEHIIKKNAEEIYFQIQNLSMDNHQLLFMFCIYYLDVQTYFNIYDRFLKSVRNGRQVLFKIEMLNGIADNYKRFMQKQKIGMKAIKALETAALGLEAEGLGFTFLHLYFVETCLQSKMYKSALRIIDKPLIHLDIKSKIEEQDFFAFQYYSGCIYLGLKRFSDARRCFKLIISLTNKELHLVYLDALKKLIILNTGNEKELSQTFESFDPINTQIVNFVSNLYKKISLNELNGFYKFLETNQKELEEEGNFGLARQMEYSFIIKDLKKLHKTYLRYKINDLSGVSKNLSTKSNNIIELQREVNKLQKIFKIDRKNNCIEFIANDEIDHQSQVLIPLKNLFGLLKGVKAEYELENEKMLIERLQTYESA